MAEKLISEGERTLAYFRDLAPDAWSAKVYGDGQVLWTIRELFEHLILSEEGLRSIFRRVADGRPGVGDDFSIDGFNAASTGKLSDLSQDELFQRYASSRARTAEFARGLLDEQYALVGRHPALGMSKLEDMLRLIYMHHTMHLRDVKSALRAP